MISYQLIRICKICCANVTTNIHIDFELLKLNCRLNNNAKKWNPDRIGNRLFFRAQTWNFNFELKLERSRKCLNLDLEKINASKDESLIGNSKEKTLKSKLILCIITNIGKTSTRVHKCGERKYTLKNTYETNNII